MIRKTLSFFAIFACLSSCASEKLSFEKVEPSIEIDLPKSMTAEYAVPVDLVPVDPKAAIQSSVEKRLKNPSKDDALNLLATSLVSVEIWDKNKFSSKIQELLKHMHPSLEDLKKFEKSKKFVIVNCIGKVGWPPRHELAARSCAASFAKDNNSCIVDLYFPKLLSADDALETLPLKSQKLDYRDWIKVINSSGERGLWMTTRGLARSGLPEIQTIDVPPQLDTTWSYVMATLAWKLVKITFLQGNFDSSSTEIEVPSRIQLTAEDLQEVYGDILDNHRPEPIEICLKMKDGRNGDEFLTVVIPNEEKRTYGEYLVLKSKQFMGGTDRIIQAAASDEMKRAMSKARAVLPEVRKRFLAEKLTPGGALLVKFRVTDGTKNEYLWAYVTSWKTPDEISGYCGNDADLDPKIRAGKPLTLRMDEIFDWAVMVDDKFVEGGLTAKVLGH